ncbi:oxaloacetate decarboxylase [Marinobacterium sp. LSUCC0821]|uniref:isocitrate lyase/PEP mutase family protein n=1 Tax=Marinobacterium sp. LSUCC0821 TaxID=2668067 RepID=UPI00145182F8|nr:isocitrate lyase/phosphoenolpyruvate mutase family protein [Marinobacterium sp. LSUCC0821]QJD70360.1 hypothetical protein HH196_00950 [Marinobacterium sp. LSUCC0821]
MTNFSRLVNSIDGYELLASSYNPIVARMARDTGFTFGMIGGSIASMSTIAAPDLMLLTSTELTDLVRRTCQASDLKIVVDGDGGYGNALNVIRTVRDLQMAGATAVTLEDTLLPITYEQNGVRVISIEEQVNKLKAALDTRLDDSFGIIARTQVLPNDSSESIASRVGQYASTGVDMMCIAGSVNSEQLRVIAEASNKPIMMITYGQSFDFTDDFLNEVQVKFLLTGHTPFENAMIASYNALVDLAGIGEHVSRDGYAQFIRKYIDQDRYGSATEKYMNIKAK